jgi:hypothetical protein
LLGIATYSYHKYQKSVHGEGDTHVSASTQPGEGDGFVPLVGVEEGTEANRQHQVDQEMYILGDDDDDEVRGGRASSSSSRRKGRAGDDEALLRRMD